MEEGLEEYHQTALEAEFFVLAIQKADIPEEVKEE
jgi:hypothetical protein